ncbi:Osmosensitive K+ channel histidine kinase KdpD [Hyphomicrobiales bacterium]|nr:Osmosensitive K+ channel histidine kinase KdpD [Hyphomicrobiales bacterium]CAH1701641.1 Osmosensitive K+ channel histidine kinase KdpD [Hyphomicrobiales bacterium]CAI0345807.1 Histidine kinase [Hyphomicrobiales bacterium]
MANSGSIQDVDGGAANAVGGTTDRQGADLPIAVGYLAALALSALATVVASALESVATVPNLSLIYVLPVIVTAIAFGFGPSMLAAVAGASAYNFFFTAPRFSLQVEDPANIWAIGLLLVVGGMASGLASLAARRQAALKLRLRQEQALQSFSSALFETMPPRDMANRAAAALEEMFHVSVVVMAPADGRLETIACLGPIEAEASEFAAARSSLDQGCPVRAGVYPFDSSRFDFWPIKAPNQKPVVLGVALDPQEYPERPDLFIVVVGRLLAAALTKRSIGRPTVAE